MDSTAHLGCTHALRSGGDAPGCRCAGALTARRHAWNGSAYVYDLTAIVLVRSRFTEQCSRITRTQRLSHTFLPYALNRLSAAHSCADVVGAARVNWEQLRRGTCAACLLQDCALRFAARRFSATRTVHYACASRGGARTRTRTAVLAGCVSCSDLSPPSQRLHAALPVSSGRRCPFTAAGVHASRNRRAALAGASGKRTATHYVDLEHAALRRLVGWVYGWRREKVAVRCVMAAPLYSAAPAGLAIST